MCFAINSIDLIESSFDGIGYWIGSGSQLVSTIATTGMPNFTDSATAITSSVISTTNKTSGNFRISIIPPKNFLSLSSSLESLRVSLFVCAIILPLENASSR